MNILFCGHLGERNFGDALMLRSLLESLSDRAPGASVTILTHSPQVSRTTCADGAVEKSFLRLSLFNALKGLSGAEAVVLCGGTHFHDHKKKGVAGCAWIVKLLRWWLFFGLARLLGAKVLYLGIGVGPFSGRLARYLTRHILRLADRFTVRDARSWHICRRLGVGKGCVPSCDLAFLGSSVNTAGRPGGGKKVGLSVLPYYDWYRGEPDGDRHVTDELAAQLTAAARQGDVNEVVLFACFASVDTPLARHLAGKIEGADVRVVEFSGDTDAFMEEMRACDCFVGFRLHSSICAALLGLPLFMILYHRKCEALAGEISLDSGCAARLSSVGNDVFAERFREFLRRPDVSYAVPPATREKAERNIDTLLDVLGRA